MVRVIPTPAGAVLHIEVDEAALEQMEHCDFELPVGFAGAVMFNSAQKRAATANLEAEEELLSKKLASVRRAIEAKKSEKESMAAMQSMSWERM